MKRTDDQAIIYITGNHPIFGAALESLLNRELSLSIINKTSRLQQKCDLNPLDKPNILLLDVAMAETSETNSLRSLAGFWDDLRIIVLLDTAIEETITGFLEKGAKGIVLKDSKSRVLIESIMAVMKGKYWIVDRKVSRIGKKDERHKRSKNPPDQNNYGITSREMDVIRAAVSGKTNREIAGKLAISEQTVKHHITNIFDKLGVYNRLELTLFVFHHGLVED